MTHLAPELFSLASRAYERARWRRAFRSAPLIAVLVVASFACCNAPAISIGIGALLVATCACCSWRGEAYGRAVWPGLGAGGCAALIPFIVMRSGVCTMETISLCMAACIAGGTLAGAAITVRAMRLEEGRRTFALIAAALAVLTGSLGCVMVGFGGVLGLFGGLVLTTTPVVLIARARA